MNLFVRRVLKFVYRHGLAMCCIAGPLIVAPAIFYKAADLLMLNTPAKIVDTFVFLPDAPTDRDQSETRPSTSAGTASSVLEKQKDGAPRRELRSAI